MEDGGVNLNNLVYIDDDVFSAINQYIINTTDIYVTIAGTIGHVGRVPEALDGHNLTENAAKIVFSEIDQNFLIHVLNGEDVQGQFADKTQAMAQPKLALKRIAGARVPIPPLADAAETQRHLADAITQQAAA